MSEAVENKKRLEMDIHKIDVALKQVETIKIYPTPAEIIVDVPTSEESFRDAALEVLRLANGRKIRVMFSLPKSRDLRALLKGFAVIDGPSGQKLSALAGMHFIPPSVHTDKCDSLTDCKCVSLERVKRLSDIVHECQESYRDSDGDFSRLCEAVTSGIEEWKAALTKFEFKSPEGGAPEFEGSKQRLAIFAILYQMAAAKGEVLWVAGCYETADYVADYLGIREDEEPDKEIQPYADNNNISAPPFCAKNDINWRDPFTAPRGLFEKMRRFQTVADLEMMRRAVSRLGN
eukprot:GHVU01173413.1.p1 GENE.GHVU01173413.1~~GHVU01173413.1.p1  ORF type:complete len:330 (-),score=40.78 GHVU01173413.1:377-1246(-)